jgi:fused signal recognition particle receptor
MSGSQYWSLIVLALLLGAAFYVPTLRRRSRERAREQERASRTSAPSATTEAPEAPEVERGPAIGADTIAPPPRPEEDLAPPAPGKAAQKPAEKAPGEAAQKPAEKAPEKAPEKPEKAPEKPAPAAPAIEQPEPTAGRLVRLRARLSRSQNVFGKGLLSLLSRDRIDDETWEELEDTLITADVGIEPPDRGTHPRAGPGVGHRVGE